MTHSLYFWKKMHGSLFCREFSLHIAYNQQSVVSLMILQVARRNKRHSMMMSQGLSILPKINLLWFPTEVLSSVFPWFSYYLVSVIYYTLWVKQRNWMWNPHPQMLKAHAGVKLNASMNEMVTAAQRQGRCLHLLSTVCDSQQEKLLALGERSGPEAEGKEKHS